MKKTNSTVVTIVLIALVILLGIAVFFVNSLISKNNSTPTVGTIQKVKAASQTYKKVVNIASNIPTATPPTDNLNGAVTTTPATTISPTDVLLAKNITPTSSLSVTPTPSTSSSSLTTSATPSISSSTTPSITTTLSPTATPSSLPQTGYMTNLIIIGAVSSLLIFFSFLF